jgi:hypothetical protein
MQNIHNGIPAADLGPEGWQKPWSNPNGGSCLEAKKLPGGRVARRQSAASPPTPTAQPSSWNQARSGRSSKAPRPASPTTS